MKQYKDFNFYLAYSKYIFTCEIKTLPIYLNISHFVLKRSSTQRIISLGYGTSSTFNVIKAKTFSLAKIKSL